jgi:hypothetical protein
MMHAILRPTARVTTLVAGVALACLAAQPGLLAQRGAGAPAQGPPASAWAAAPIDLTGYWVSIVNEDWRWRMVTPPKGDTASVPLNPRGTQAAAAWDPATDGSCQAYGMAGLMRMPTRLHITWADDHTLKIETDNGEQTRLLHFDAAQPGPKSLQGFSRAEWDRGEGSVPLPLAGRGAPGGGNVGRVNPRAGGDLKVMTTDLSGGWLRRNGVPYSADATVTEYFDRFPVPDGSEWFAVTTIVHDPMYLQQDFITSSHFRREPDGAKWAPTPCKATT